MFRVRKSNIPPLHFRSTTTGVSFGSGGITKFPCICRGCCHERYRRESVMRGAYGHLGDTEKDEGINESGHTKFSWVCASSLAANMDILLRP